MFLKLERNDFSLVLNNKNMIDHNLIHKQDYSSRSDILPLKSHTFKSKMKESKV